MRPGLWSVAAFLLTASCGHETARYLEPHHLFSCAAPARWRVLEDQGGAQRVTFLGPAGGLAPYSAAISVFYYARKGSNYASAEDYAKAQSLLPGATGPVVSRSSRGLTLYEFSAARPVLAGRGADEAPERRESTVLITAPAGFYAVVYAAPAKSFSENEPLFRDLVDSLRFVETR